MKKVLSVLGILLLLGSLGTAFWFFWPVFFPQKSVALPGFLLQIDSDISAGRFDKAKKLFQDLPDSLSAQEWLRVLKRADYLALNSQDLDFPLPYAQKASNQLPGNQSLEAYWVWVLCRAGKTDQALKQAGNLKDTSWESFYTQASIENVLKQKNANTSGTLSWEALRQQLNFPPSLNDDIFDTLLPLTNDSAFIKDALLASLLTGNPDRAAALMERVAPMDREKPPFDRIQALLAYDRGDWGQVKLLLTKGSPSVDRESQLLLADVLLHTESIDTARLVFDQLLKDNPGKLPVSTYLNRALLALRENDPQLSYTLLEQARSFGDLKDDLQTRWKLLYWQTLFNLGQKEKVRTQMLSVLKQAEVDGDTEFSLDTELLRLSLDDASASLDRLWTLYRRNPNYPPVTERLAWTLIQLGQGEKSLAVLSAFTDKNPQAPLWWVYYYKAIAFSSLGHFEQALDAYDQIDLPHRDRCYHTNVGLTDLLFSRMVEENRKDEILDNALEHFNQSLDELPPSSDKNLTIERSRVLTNRASAFLALAPLVARSRKDEYVEKAAEDLQAATSLDPQNRSAAFLARELRAVKDNNRDQSQNK